MSEPLRQLARTFGVETRYHDIDGVERHASPEALLLVLRALGAQIEQADGAEDALRAHHAAQAGAQLEPVHVAWDGQLPAVLVSGGPLDGPARLTLALEAGETRDWPAQGEPTAVGDRLALRFAVPGPLPFGYHSLDIEIDGRLLHTTILASPRLAFLPTQSRSWGVLLPLHAYGNRTRGGIASYADLARVRDWSARLGGAFVSTLPLLASFLAEPFEPSPYLPASRLFWNELFIDSACAPGGDAGDAIDVPDTGDLVDYRCIARRRRKVLERAMRRFFDSGGDRDRALIAFVQREPQAVDYARFRAACDRLRTPWQRWPARLRDGALRDDDVDSDALRYHLYAAWVADAQLTAAARAADAGAGLYLDLPLGVHGAGYDIWRERALFARQVSAGAPPDPFFREGQNWGFPPLVPGALRADGYRYFAACLRHHLRLASVLRLDHAMSLQRLFWIPDGLVATSGVYVNYPQDELFAVLTLESHRHHSLLVGEDLGTVTPELRRALDEHRIRRMYVAQFELRPDRDPPLSAVPENVAASVNTHDLPTFAGFCAGLDLDDWRALGLLDDAAWHQARESRTAIRDRLRRWAGTPVADDSARTVLNLLLHTLAASPAALLLVNLEDLWLETRPQNVPGTTTERPNWRRRAHHTVDSLLADAGVADALRTIARLREESGTTGER